MVRTSEQEKRIHDNIHRADALGHAVRALDTAVEFEEDRNYAAYLDTFVRTYLEEEAERAQEAHRAYLRELGVPDPAVAEESTEVEARRGLYVVRPPKEDSPAEGEGR